MNRFFILPLIFLASISFSQNGPGHSGIQKVEPPSWWTGMKNPDLQLLVYGIDISKTLPSVDHPGVVLVESQKVENPNYLFIKLRILPECKAGKFDIRFSRDGAQVDTWSYELRERKAGSAERKGFDRKDAIYLLMPDRFSNGNPDNDSVKSMAETVNREDPDGRHGGDIKGILDHLDYIRATGFTALWINPLMENNNPEFSYHGYAITDFYRTDPRFGTIKDYLDLVNTCHGKGLKVIMDMVFNHCSVYHWLIRDLPASDWIHAFDTYTESNFRSSTLIDPYASDYDRTKMQTGWFDKHMADLDQRNPLLTTYLIQNTIWWLEFSGADGIRVDTQPYSYQPFISKWAEAVFREYPALNIVGEAWLQKESLTAYFQQGANNKDGYDSNIPSVTDFPFYYALNAAFNEKDTWTKGLLRIYYVLAQDNLYHDPFENLIFVDNHDLTRFYTDLHADFRNWKMAMAILATMRGIPCIYYGTEILMEGNKEDGHGTIREDFPGGWPGDERNCFETSGRTTLENEAYEYIRKLYTWRKNRDEIHSGEFKHYIPKDDVYVYFRYTAQKSVMVAVNKNEHEMKALDHKKFEESLDGYTFGRNVITGELINYLDAITIPPKSAVIIELKK